MSLPALILVLFGSACFLATGPTVSLAAPHSSKPIPNNSDEQIPIQPQIVRSRRDVDEAPIIRRDYKYTRGIGGHKVHKVAAKWNNARTTCKSEGGDLAVINSAAESNILVRLLRESKPHSGSADSNYAFTGFHDLFGEGQYETVDGNSLSEAGFNQWAAGEPDNGNGNTENCGAIYKDGKLSDAACTKRYAYVCELPFPPFPDDYTPPDVEEDIPIEELIETIIGLWDIWKSKRPKTTTTTRRPPTRGGWSYTPRSSYNWNYGYSGNNLFSSSTNDATLGLAAGLGAAAAIGAAGLPLLMIG